MLPGRKDGTRVVGIKQTMRAIKDGRASHVFYAQDADPELIAHICERCQEAEIPVTAVPRMADLGATCGIDVGAAAAAQVQ